MKTVLMADAVRYPHMTTRELRASFLFEDLYQAGTIRLAYVDLDRTVVGMAVPLETALALPTSPELRAAYFTERRELGVLNIGGTGAVSAGNPVPFGKFSNRKRRQWNWYGDVIAPAAFSSSRGGLCERRAAS